MKTFKQAVVCLLVLFAVIHTTCTLLYVLPENLVPAKLKHGAKRYMVPLFDQGWALFAPVPEVNKKIFVSYLQDNKQWSGWELPFDEYVAAYQSNRASASGKVVLSVSAALHYLYNENKPRLLQQKSITGNRSSGYFKVLEQAIKNKLMWQYKNNNKIRVLLVYTTANCAQAATYAVYYPEFETEK